VTEEPIYVTYSEDVRQALARADVDLAALVRAELAKDGIQAQVQLAPDPTADGAEDRDVFLLILAGGVAASLVGSAVARVIDAVTQRRRAAMEEKELEVALDADGRPVRDRAGNPAYNLRTKPADVAAPATEKTSFNVGKLLKFDFSRS
jgi:hypothetical protein